MYNLHMKSAKLFRGKLRTTPKYVSFIFFSPSLDDIKTNVYLQEKARQMELCPWLEFHYPAKFLSWPLAMVSRKLRTSPCSSSAIFSTICHRCCRMNRSSFCMCVYVYTYIRIWTNVEKSSWKNGDCKEFWKIVAGKAKLRHSRTLPNA